MHEISLMQAALTVALDHAQTHGDKHIHRLQLQVGELSSVDPDALAFAFDVVTQGTLAEKAEAERLRQTGQQVVRINTGNLCHLEAKSVAEEAQQLDLDTLNLLIIENVGNLVCPAAYDLGEDLLC